jgi:hypothetical protein
MLLAPALPSLFTTRFSVSSLAIRIALVILGFALATWAGLVEVRQSGHFYVWVTILTLPGFDLRRAAWEPWKVRGVSPASITLQSLVLRWVPVAIGLTVAWAFGTPSASTLLGLANCLLIASLGVLVGHGIPTPWILIPILWVASATIPVLSRGRFLDLNRADFGPSFSVRLAATTLVAFALAMLDRELIARGRPGPRIQP